MGVEGPRGQRVERQWRGGMRERDRGRMMESKTERNRKEANAKKWKIKDEERFRIGDEAVEEEGKQQTDPLAL